MSEETNTPQEEIVEQPVEGTQQPQEQDVTEDLNKMIRGLQREYTKSRQEIADLKAKIASSYQPEEGDEYLTVGKTREILRQELEARERSLEEQRRKNQQVIDSQIDDLMDNGIIKSQKEADQLIKYAIDNKIQNLYLASTKWVASKGNESAAQKAETKAKQEAASKVGNSSKASTNDNVISWKETQRTGWDEI